MVVLPAFLRATLGNGTGGLQIACRFAASLSLLLLQEGVGYSQKQLSRCQHDNMKNSVLAHCLVLSDS